MKDEINAFLGAGTEYSGKLSFSGTVRIDGTFFGEINSDGALVAGKDCHIEATINVSEFILNGNFNGTANVKKRTTIHKTGQFEGELFTQALIVEDGANIDGTINMLKRNNSQAQQQALSEDIIEIITSNIN